MFDVNEVLFLEDEQWWEIGISTDESEFNQELSQE